MMLELALLIALGMPVACPLAILYGIVTRTSKDNRFIQPSLISALVAVPGWLAYAYFEFAFPNDVAGIARGTGEVGSWIHIPMLSTLVLSTLVTLAAIRFWFGELQRSRRHSQVTRRE